MKIYRLHIFKSVSQKSLITQISKFNSQPKVDRYVFTLIPAGEGGSGWGGGAWHRKEAASSAPLSGREKFSGIFPEMIFDVFFQGGKTWTRS